jgi:site-specific DNA recombinase
MNPIPQTKPGVAVAYRRVSSDEQTRGFGLAVQKRIIGGFAKREGLRIAADFHEDARGSIPLAERRGLRDALDACLEHGAGVLLVADKSRLARDEYAAFDALRAFNMAGVVVLFADGQNSDGLAGSIGHLVAADEKRNLVTKLERGRAEAADEHPHARKQGGRVPYGYRRVKNGIEVVDDEAEIVQLIFALAMLGKSQARIADDISKRTGRRWSPATIQGILNRDIYMLKAPGRIVAPQTWHAVRRKQKANRRRDRDSSGRLAG